MVLMQDENEEGEDHINYLINMIIKYLMPWPPLSFTFGLKRTRWPQPAQSSKLHVLYINICSRDTSYHLSCISAAFCLGPPWSALAMPGSPRLYLCHRSNPEECLWQVYRRCCLLLPDWGCLHGCMNRQANTSHRSWQQTLVFHWSSNKHAVRKHWGRDLCDMPARSGARGVVFFYSIWTMWMYRHHIARMLCL